MDAGPPRIGFAADVAPPLQPRPCLLLQGASGSSRGAAGAAAGGLSDTARAPREEGEGAGVDPAIAAWWKSQHYTATAAGTAPAFPASFDVTVSPVEPLQAAIDRCREGGNILLLPGAYEGGVVLSKEVHLYGRGEAMLRRAVGEGNVITSTAPAATLDGLVVRLGPHAEGEEGNFGILITAGSLLVRHCDVSSQSRSNISVQGASANPTILGCKVHGSKKSGIYFEEDTKGRVEGCDIVDNICGVFIHDAEPLIIANKVHSSKESGVCCKGISRTRLESNQIWENDENGVDICGDSDPFLIDNNINGNKGSGVVVYDEGKGRLDRNLIFGNRQGGICVEDRGDPTLRFNIIRDHSGEGFGVFVHGSAFGNVVWGGGNKFSGNEVADLGGYHGEGEEAAPEGGHPAQPPAVAPLPATPADANLLRELECVVCLGTMLRPLTVCGRGHSACMECYERLDPRVCPKCRDQLLPRPIRLLPLEGLAQELLVPCPNVADGCPLVALRYADAAAHVTMCGWRKVTARSRSFSQRRPLSCAPQYLSFLPLTNLITFK